MEAERWKRIEDLFEAARQKPAEQRTDFVCKACGDDLDLGAEVASLLKAAEDRDSFLDGAALSSIAERPSTLKAGDTLGNFQIVSLLGRGGMGEVWRARDPRLRRDVAIKVLPPNLARDPGRIARFEREARAASALNHPNIIIVHEIGQADDVLFIVSEVLEGETLGGILERGPLSLRKLIDMATQICEGLAAAHAAGVVHRDLKPGNIMLNSDGRVKILDFGLARRDRALGADSSTIEVSQPGLILGTAGYMSPEQVRGEPADARSDLFSLGLILYEMASGKRAFSGNSSIEVMNAILKDEPPELPAAAPPELGRIVRRCIEKQPSRRFQSVSDLGFALHSLSPPAPAASRSLPGKSNRSLVTIAALAGIGLLAAVAWLTSPKPTPRVINTTQITNDGSTNSAYSRTELACSSRPGLISSPRYRQKAARPPLPWRWIAKSSWRIYPRISLSCSSASQFTDRMLSFGWPPRSAAPPGG
jgi:serine/threonine protein kinase